MPKILQRAYRSELVIFSVALVVYSRSLLNQFAFDDLIHVANAPSLQFLTQSLSSPLFPGNLYRPLVTISYGLTQIFFGYTPLPYHLTNVILHAIISILVFQILKILSAERTSFFSALIFAAHPIHSEVVANVSGRAELLSALFGLSLICYLLRKGVGDSCVMISRFSCALCGFFVFVLFLCALLSKENAVVIPFLLLLILRCRPEKLVLKSHGLRVTSCAFGITLAIYCLLRLVTFQGSLISADSISLLDNPLAGLSSTSRAAHAFVLLGKYIYLCIFPYPLSADYSYAHLEAFLPAYQTYSYFFLCWGLVLLALWGSIRRNNYGLFAGWFLVAFAVTSNVLFPIGTIFGERLAYLPSLGLIALLVELLLSVLGSWVLWILVLIAGTQTFSHTSVWFNNKSLHSYQLQVSPESAKTQYNYAMLLKQEGEFTEAESYVRKALEIFPAYDDAAWALGSLLAVRNDLTAAEHWYQQALQISPTHLPALNDMARLELNRAGFNQCARLLERIFLVDPKNLRAQITQFALYLNQAKWDQARTIQAKLAGGPAEADADYLKLNQELQKHLVE